MKKLTGALPHLTALCVLALATGGCASQKFVGRPDLKLVDKDAMPAPTRDDLTMPARPYVIGPSDQLAIDVFGVPELSRGVTVDLAGRISLPLTGSMIASGMTADELSADIERKLRGQYVRDPKVSVNITAAANQVITVDGAVGAPGVYPVLGRMTLMRAIAKASGTTEFTQEDYVVVFRRAQGQEYAMLYDIRAIRQGMYPDPEIYTNDLIVVGESRARRIFKDLLSSGPLLATPIIALINNGN